MKIRVLADRAVVVSAVAYDDMAKIAKYEPEVMTLKDKDGNATFAVMVGTEDSVSDYGVCFIKEGDKAIARIDLPVGEEDKAEYVADKIFSGLVEGRISKQVKEISLMDQVYVKAEDGKQTVAAYLASVNKDLAIAKFVRFEVGEGMEKKNEDFAAEVAAQMANA